MNNFYSFNFSQRFFILFYIVYSIVIILMSLVKQLFMKNFIAVPLIALTIFLKKASEICNKPQQIFLTFGYLLENVSSQILTLQLCNQKLMQMCGTPEKTHFFQKFCWGFLQEFHLKSFL